MRCAGHVDVLGGEVEEERLVLLAVGEVLLRPIDEHVRHRFVVPQRGLAPPLVTDTADAIDHRAVVAMRTLVVGHRLAVLLAVRIDGAREVLGLLADVEWICRVEIQHAVAVEVDARHPIVRRGQQERHVESDLEWSRPHDPIPIHRSHAVADAQVPLSDHRCFKTRLLEQLRQREHVRLDLHGRVRREHAHFVAEAVDTSQHGEA